MRRVIFFSIITLLLLGIVAVAGCAKTEYLYVCVNGSALPDKNMCPSNKLTAVKKTDAEEYAKRYVSAYFVPYGGKAQLVSSYLDRDKGDHMATFIVSEKGGSPYETIVAIDGLKGNVTCIDKCGYVSR